MNWLVLHKKSRCVHCTLQLVLLMLRVSLVNAPTSVGRDSLVPCMSHPVCQKAASMQGKGIRD